MSDSPLISIVVPTYNEQEDIRLTLEALVGLDYPRKEILVVDDSTDRTPEIVREFTFDGVRLIRPAVNGGRAGARNLGILEARGEIVVVLNADVRPSADFLTRIVPHYERGADFLLVQSEVANREHLLARYIEAVHRSNYPDVSKMWWTEGFSCRRAAALAAGLFPAGFPIPLRAGEDGCFGQALERRCRKAIDTSIVVRHVAPHRLSDFWKERVSRGVGTPLYKRFVDRMPLAQIAAQSLLKTLYACAVVFAVAPMLARGYRLSRHSPRRAHDVLPLAAAATLERVGQILGEWIGLVRLWRLPRGQEAHAPRAIRLSSGPFA